MLLPDLRAKINAGGKKQKRILEKSMHEKLSKAISSRGVQFMATEEDIQVRLSAAGKTKYRRQLHLRPTLIRNDGPENDIFVFNCTAAQAEFYSSNLERTPRFSSPPACGKGS